MMGRHPLVESLVEAGLKEQMATVWTLALRDVQNKDKDTVARALLIMADYLRRDSVDLLELP